MNQKLNNSFIEVTKNIFLKLFSTELTSDDAYIVDDKNHEWDISGVVGSIGQYEGIITVRLKEDVASKVLEKSRLETPDVAARWNLVNDMIGEIVNNISGNVLSNIVDEKFKLSVPIVIQGKNHILQWPKTAPIVALPFTMEYGTLEVQYSLLVN